MHFPCSEIISPEVTISRACEDLVVRHLYRSDTVLSFIQNLQEKRGFRDFKNQTKTDYLIYKFRQIASLSKETCCFRDVICHYDVTCLRWLVYNIFLTTVMSWENLSEKISTLLVTCIWILGKVCGLTFPEYILWQGM